MKPKSPDYKVGTAKRDGELSLYTNAPGATAYSPKDEFTKTHASTWK